MKGWRLVTETPRIEVTSDAPRRDPKWAFTDAAGHLHTWASEGESFYWAYLGVAYCCDHDEYEDYGQYQCRQCEEEITPGMVGPSPVREFIPGPMEAWLEGPEGRVIPLTNEQINSIRGATEDEVTQALQAIIDEHPPPTSE